MKIFVYGTLKRGHGNNRLLQGVSRFIGSALTVQTYPMLYGYVPVLFKINHPRALRIKGELFEITDKRYIYPIDSLEGHPYWYKREIIKVEVDNEIHEAWCYFQDGESFRKTIQRSFNVRFISEYQSGRMMTYD